MKAIGYQISKPLTDKDAFVRLDLPTAVAKAHDLLVKISAISVNPVDCWTYQSQTTRLSKPRILGFDAVGIVCEVGDQVTLFHKGDRVFYAGSFIRQGSYADYQLVDERLVAKAPKNLSDTQCAAMPLTALTAWESLFEKMPLDFADQKSNHGKSLLVINGAGGVGSVAIQLAKLAGLTVIATASRPQTKAWCQKMGADLVIDHHQNLLAQINEAGGFGVDEVLELHGLEDHWSEFPELVKPLGTIVSITSSPHDLDLNPLKHKAINFSWEWMFAKSFYGVDLMSQHHILTKVSQLLEGGALKSTQTELMTGLTTQTIQSALEKVMSAKMIGKLVIAF